MKSLYYLLSYTSYVIGEDGGCIDIEIIMGRWVRMLAVFLGMLHFFCKFAYDFI